MRLTSSVILRQERVDEFHYARLVFTMPSPWTYLRAASLLADKWPTSGPLQLRLSRTDKWPPTGPPQSCWFIHVCCMCEQPFRCSTTPTTQYDYGACTCRMRDYALWPICKNGEQTSTREQCAHPVCSKECQRARRRPVFY